VLDEESVQTDARVQDALAGFGAASVDAKRLDALVMDLNGELFVRKRQLAALGPGEEDLGRGLRVAGA
jgi:hypothetical protein